MHFKVLFVKTCGHFFRLQFVNILLLSCITNLFWYQQFYFISWYKGTIWLLVCIDIYIISDTVIYGCSKIVNISLLLNNSTICMVSIQIVFFMLMYTSHNNTSVGVLLGRAYVPLRSRHTFIHIYIWKDGLHIQTGPYLGTEHLICSYMLIFFSLDRYLININLRASAI